MVFMGMCLHSSSFSQALPSDRFPIITTNPALGFLIYFHMGSSPFCGTSQFMYLCDVLITLKQYKTLGAVTSSGGMQKW